MRLAQGNLPIALFLLAIIPSGIIMENVSATSVKGTVTIIQHPSITVLPTSGPGESKLIISGTNFMAMQKIRLTFVDSANHSDLLGAVTTDDTGSFAMMTMVPTKAAPGSYTIYPMHNGAILASASFTVPFPLLTIYPASGNVGTLVRVTGSSFTLNENVNLFIGTSITSHLKKIGAITTDSAGSFTTQVAIPSSLAAGNYFISAREAINNNVYAAVPFTVILQSTNIVITSSVNPSVFGQSVKFTAAVTPSSAAGTVTFTVDGKAKPPVKLSAGTATLVISSLASGPHLITATYSGDENFASAKSAPMVQKVIKHQ